MKKSEIRLLPGVIMGVFAVVLCTSGCSTTSSVLSILKFWGNKDKAERSEMEKTASFSSKVRPARGNPDSHYTLGAYYQKQGYHKKALDEFRKAVAIDPMHARAYNGMGVSCDNLKDFEGAQDAYYVALKIEPNKGYIYNNLGYSFILRGDYQSAAEMLEKAVSLDPNNAQVRHNLAEAYAALGKSKKALAVLQDSHSPARARFMLAQALQEKGKFEAADTLYAEAALMEPSLKEEMGGKDRFINKIAHALKAVKEKETAVVLAEAEKEIDQKGQVVREETAAAKVFVPAREMTTERPMVPSRRQERKARLARSEEIKKFMAMAVKPVVVTQRPLTEAKGVKVDLRRAKLEPDYLLKKPVAENTGRTNTESRPAPLFLHELFPVRHVSTQGATKPVYPGGWF
ncbi:tetratricopeptide repeat protein [Syntrophorhabdus aromaticivorans]|uniref:tetratricopeptide repeat protein n=1 Tax=Syntrophorhabdus aromaticivorans TaxID=328301 RepID=UPI00041F8127|nr:tetratricopeptide repeat protein [Syntrophorhabdus aromaticivorans]